MDWPPVLTFAEAMSGWFTASAGPLTVRLFFADWHGGRRREGSKYWKREFFRLDP
jgi:hypothetical protein